MQKWRWAVSVLVVAGLSLAPAALAHEGHTSCGDGAQEFTVPLAQSGQAGEVISEEGKAGTADETGEALHEAGCEPKD